MVRVTGHAGLSRLVPAMAIALAPYADVLRYMPLAIFAGMAIWIVYEHLSRWSRMAPDLPNPDEFWIATPAYSPLQAPYDGTKPVAAGPTATFAAADGAARGFLPVIPDAAPGAGFAPRAPFVATDCLAPTPGLMPRGVADAPHRVARHELRLECSPTRFTRTLGHVALRYRLDVRHCGTRSLGPLVIHADLVAGAPGTPLDCFGTFDPDDLPLCHYLDGLPASGAGVLTGELRLIHPSMGAIRLGLAELLVPLLRIQIESVGQSPPALTRSACFAIGLPGGSAGGSIRPFALNSGTQTWRNLAARRLEEAEFGTNGQLPLDGGQARG